jgi:hypothetical protein
LTAERSRIGSRRGWLISFGIIGGVALVMVLTSYPLVPETISGNIVAPGTCTYCPDIQPVPKESIPSGVSVTVTWSGSLGDTGDFEVTNSTFWPVCFSSASRGTCTFVSSGGNYTLSIIRPTPPTESSYGVSFSIEWYVPLL